MQFKKNYSLRYDRFDMKTKTLKNFALLLRMNLL